MDPYYNWYQQANIMFFDDEFLDLHENDYLNFSTKVSLNHYAIQQELSKILQASNIPRSKYPNQTIEFRQLNHQFIANEKTALGTIKHPAVFIDEPDNWLILHNFLSIMSNHCPIHIPDTAMLTFIKSSWLKQKEEEEFKNTSNDTFLSSMVADKQHHPESQTHTSTATAFLEKLKRK